MTIKLKPWTKINCDYCGIEYQATRCEPKEIEEYICSDCITYNKAHDSGYKQGKEAGYKEGLVEGIKLGLNAKNIELDKIYEKLYDKKIQDSSS